MGPATYLSKLDAVYRSYLLTQYFVKGWGDPQNIQKIFKFRKIVSDRAKCTGLVDVNYPIHIDSEVNDKNVRIIDGHFTSPLVHYLADVIPKESHKAYFQMVLPKVWKHPRLRPMCIQLAGTGDHRFWRRRTLIAKPLEREYGIGSILLENPYYGDRKPKEQVRSVLQNVSDVFVMGGCLILESIALLLWCERQGFGPLALTGFSMGGHMASLAGGSFDRPVGVVPCLSWTTASCVFTQGVMSGAIPWQLLQDQYFQQPLIKKELSKMVQSPGAEDERTFMAGQEFARQVSHEMATYDRKETPPKQTSTAERLTENIASPRSSLPSCRHAGRTNQPLQILESGSVSTSLTPDVQDDGVRDPLQEGSSTKSGTSCFLHQTQIGRHFPALEDVDQYPATERGSHPTYYTRRARSEPSTTSDESSTSFSTTLARLVESLPVEYLQFGVQPSKQKALEAWNFMRGIMDECTHLGNFGVPVDPTLAICVAATRDAYVPRDNTLDIRDVWPGCEVRYLDCGHITGFIFNQHRFREAIADSLNRCATKYYSETLFDANPTRKYRGSPPVVPVTTDRR